MNHFASFLCTCTYCVHVRCSAAALTSSDERLQRVQLFFLLLFLLLLFCLCCHGNIVRCNCQCAHDDAAVNVVRWCLKNLSFFSSFVKCVLCVFLCLHSAAAPTIHRSIIITTTTTVMKNGKPKTIVMMTIDLIGVCMFRTFLKMFSR